MLNESNAGSPRDPARILAIGIDAGEPALVEKWMAEGALPTLRGVAERGCCARLDSVADTFCDGVWATFFTGTGPAVHGHYHLRQVKPGTVQWVPSDNLSYKRPFWWLLGPLNKRVTIFDVPKVRIQEDGRGLQVIGWGEHYPFIHDSRPPSLLREIERRFGKHPHNEEVFPTRSVNHEKKLLKKIILGAERRAEAARFLMDEAPWDLFLTAFSETHSAGHQFHHHLDPDSPAHDPDRAKKMKEAMKDSYRGVDRALASILEAAPPGTDVFVFSLHGVQTDYATHSLLRPLLTRLGYTVPLSGGKRDPVRLLRDNIPQGVRDRINDILPRSVQDKVLGRFFERGCDWTRTRAVAEESREGPPWVRINLRGREPWGTVEPGQEYQELCEELTGELMKLKIHPGGQRAVREVQRTDQLFSGPHLKELPDLIIHWERGTAISTVEHPTAGIVTGDMPAIQRVMHSPQAFLAAEGPHIKPGGQLSSTHIMDLAPTLLYLSGGEIPSDMEGRVLHELIRDDYRSNHPARFKETSWDVDAWEQSI